MTEISRREIVAGSAALALTTASGPAIPRMRSEDRPERAALTVAAAITTAWA